MPTPTESNAMSEQLAARGYVTLPSIFAHHSQSALDVAASNARRLALGEGWGGSLPADIGTPVRDTTRAGCPNVDEKEAAAYRLGRVERCIRWLVDGPIVQGLTVITTAPRSGNNVAWHFDGTEGKSMPIEAGAPIGIVAIFPIDDFTAANGATEIYERGRDRLGVPAPLVARCGDAVLFLGTACLHRRGTNTTDRTRSGVFLRYYGTCSEWLVERVRLVGGTLVEFPRVARMRAGEST